MCIGQVDMLNAPKDLSAVEALVKGINSEAVFLHTQHSRVDIRAVLNRGVYRDAEWSERWSEGHVPERQRADGVHQGKGPSTREQQSSSSSRSNEQLHSRNPPAFDTFNASSGATAPDRAGFSNDGHVNHGGQSHTHRAGITTLTLRAHRRLDLQR